MQCLIDGCARSAAHSDGGRKGFCSTHYQRLKRHGDAFVVKPTPSPANDWIDANKSHTGDDCLVWPFHVGEDGYGRVHRRGNGALTTASRLMCIKAHGEPPTSAHEAAHSCGAGAMGCVNPKHLYWATPAQNQIDRIAHGTSNRGEQQWQSKLTVEVVRNIKREIGSASQATIARRYGIDPSHVSDIKRGKRWGWLTD